MDSPNKPLISRLSRPKTKIFVGVACSVWLVTIVVVGLKINDSSNGDTASKSIAGTNGTEQIGSKKILDSTGIQPLNTSAANTASKKPAIGSSSTQSNDTNDGQTSEAPTSESPVTAPKPATMTNTSAPSAPKTTTTSTVNLPPSLYPADKSVIDILRSRVIACTDNIASQSRGGTLTSQSGLSVTEKCLNDVTINAASLKTSEAKYIYEIYKTLLTKLTSAFRAQISSGNGFSSSDPNILDATSYYSLNIVSINDKYSFIASR